MLMLMNICPGGKQVLGPLQMIPVNQAGPVTEIWSRSCFLCKCVHIRRQASLITETRKPG